MIGNLRERLSLPILGLLVLLVILLYFVHQAWIGEVEPTLVTAFATTALVLVTLYYAYQSRIYAQYSRDTLDEMRRTREKRGKLFILAKGLDPIVEVFEGHLRKLPPDAEDDYQPHRSLPSFTTMTWNLLLDLENHHDGFIDRMNEYADLLDAYSDLQFEIWQMLLVKVSRDIHESTNQRLKEKFADVNLGEIYDDVDTPIKEKNLGELLPNICNVIINLPEPNDIEDETVREVWELRKDQYIRFRDEDDLQEDFEELDRLLADIREENEELINLLIQIREEYKYEYGLTEAEILEFRSDELIEDSPIAEVI